MQRNPYGYYSEREICEIAWLGASEHQYNMTNIGLNTHSDKLCDISGKKQAAPENRTTTVFTSPLIETASLANDSASETGLRRSGRGTMPCSLSLAGRQRRIRLPGQRCRTARRSAR